MRNFILIFFVLPILGFGCRATQLPAERPSDFVLTWIEGGGMDPEGSTAVISAEETIWTIQKYSSGERKKDVITFAVRDEEFDELYALLRANAIDTIAQDGEGIMDGDNAGLEMRWDDHFVSLWGMAVVEKDFPRYQTVYRAIGTWLDEKNLLLDVR